MRKGNLEGLAILGVDDHGHRLADSELSAEDVDLVIGLDLVVVGGVREGEGKHTLLLQVGLVDASEGAGDDGETAKVTGLESGVLAGRPLTVVPVTDDDPLDALGLVVTGNGGNSVVLTSGDVLDLVGLTVGLVDGTDEHVVGDVVQMTTVLEPGTGHGDVISGGLALGLDQDREILGVLAIPRREGLEDLETVRARGDLDLNGSTVGRRSLVGILTRIESSVGETLSARRSEEELVAILVLQLIGERVKVEGASNGHGNNKIGGCDERVGGGVAVVATSEVTVVGREDRVGLTLLDIPAIPLTDAGTASVGEDDTTELLESLELPIAGNGGANLLGTRGDNEGRLGLEAVVKSITGDRGTARHILVRGVGAGADQTDLELLGPAIGLDGSGELGDGGGKIRGERTVDVGLELGKVDLEELVVLGTLVGLELVGEGVSESGNISTLGGLEVRGLLLGVIEDGSGSTNFGSMIAGG